MDAGPPASDQSALEDWLRLLPAAVTLAMLLPLGVWAAVAAARADMRARRGYTALPESDFDSAVAADQLDASRTAHARRTDSHPPDWLGASSGASRVSGNADVAATSNATAAATATGAQVARHGGFNEPSDGKNESSWARIAALAAERRPATLMELSIVWVSAAAVAQQVAACICAAPGDRPLDAVRAALWAACWLCMLLLSLCALEPESPSPRSLALFRLVFVADEAWTLVTCISETAAPLQVGVRAAGLALALVVSALDLANPPRNAAEINRIRIDKRAVSPETTASLWSYLTFAWINPLLSAGRAKSLEAEDLPHIAREDQMRDVIRRWKRIRVRSNNVFWDILRLTHRFAFFQIFATILTSSLSFSTTFFVNRILVWIQSSHSDKNGMLWGGSLLLCMFACSIVRNILDSQVGLSGRHWGIQIRSVLVHELFSKSLRRAEKSGPSKREGDDTNENIGATQGKIINLMSADTNQIRYFMTDIHSMLIDTPLSIIISVSGLLALMGLPALAGLVVIIVSGPISAIALKSIYKISGELRSFRDRRIQITNEVLQGIRIIKYMAWEPQFSKRILEAREHELKSHYKLILSYLLITFVSWCSNILVTFTSFFFYTVVAGRTLDAATAFTSITLLSIAADTLSSLSEDVSSILEIKVIMNRIVAFLAEEELERFNGDETKKDHSLSASKTKTFKRPMPSMPVVGFVDAELTYYSTKDGFGATLGRRRQQKLTSSPLSTTLEQSRPQPRPQKPSHASRLFSKLSFFKNRQTDARSRTPTTANHPNDAEQEPLLAKTTSTVNTNEDIQAHTFFLRDMNIAFPIGQLTAIVGPTGSGKSSLLAALLGELKRLSGETFLQLQTPEAIDRGTSQTDIAYVAQVAWLMNATVRDNILFGQPYDEERYTSVLSACALTRDLATFPAGDLTEIGVQGVNLSGGQKQRVSLARATYSHASVILLDDALSAVDAPTARHLFHQCILCLLRGRTVLLVSHAASLVVPLSDYTVVMRNGQVLAQGAPTEVMSNPEVGMMIELEASSESTSQGHADGGGPSKSDEDGTKDNANAKADPKVPIGSEADEDAMNPAKGKIITKEEKATGQIKFSTFFTYFMYCGGLAFASMLFFAFLCHNGADYLSSWWIERWTDSFARPGANGSDGIADQAVGIFAVDRLSSRSDVTVAKISNFAVINPPTIAHQQSQSSWTTFAASSASNLVDGKKEALFYISIYGLISLIELFGVLLRTAVVNMAGIRAGRTLHAKMLDSVLASPLQFFEQTPTGRLVNRFSKDLSDVDGSVAPNLSRFNTLLFGLVFRIIMVGYVTPPFLVSILMFYFYWRIAQHYLASSREIKRIESVSSSPVYAQFSESLSGVSTIRAYGAEDRMVSHMERCVDANHRAFFYLYAANRWLSLRTSILSAAIVFIAGVSVLLSDLSAGWAGVAFSFTSSFTMMMIRLIQMHSNLEISMNSVERVQEYAKLPSEPPAIVESYRTPPGWPNAAALVVKDLVIKYRPDLPPALKGISFEMRPREKLGVVGRSGAGKSTLSIALFRILPFVGGSIEIDGIDISRIGLRDLRSNLTVISQDPLLFEGTLRSNLDPLSMHTDAEIWDALRLTNVLESLQKPQEQRVVASDNDVLVEDADDVAAARNAPSPSSSSAPAVVVPVKAKRKDKSKLKESSPEPMPSKALQSGNSQSLTLDAHVSEGGSNFSQGQKQLLCLARALLRSRRFIFLDEATASVDAETDARIQETIRTQFRDASVLTVAHRLRTIIDFDRVLVLDNGQIAEIGTPYELLQRDGLFASMCRQSGEMDVLVQIATQCHKDLMAKAASSSTHPAVSTELASAGHS